MTTTSAANPIPGPSVGPAVEPRGPAAAPGSTPRSGGLREVDAATLKTWLDERKATLVDVREADEHARERIAGARSVPLSTFSAAAVPDAAEGVLVLHCLSGGRSTQAAQRLLASGRAEVWQLKGGLDAWKRAGLGVQIDRSAPIPIMRQVQIVAGSLVLIGVLLSALVSPWFLILSGFIGTGLVFAGSTGWCGMAMLLQKMPWNRGTSRGG